MSIGYHQILPKDIFIYKALPNDMRNRVLQLPSLPELATDTLSTGFPLVDAQQKRERVARVDFSSLPERKLSGCSFMDAFATLVHQYGFKGMDFYAEKIHPKLSSSMEGSGNKLISISSTELSNALKILTGMVGREWVASYTLMMSQDLQRRTNLKHYEIGRLLHFPSRQSFTYFKTMYLK